MAEYVLVRGARQLLTLQGRSGPRQGEEMRRLAVIQDGSILISGGAIVRIGPSRQVDNVAEARNAVEISAAGRVVMPAFVDCHTQMVAARLSDARTHGSPIQHALEWVRNAAPSTLESHARRYVEASLRHGTLSLEIKSGAGLNAASEAKILRVISKLRDLSTHITPTFCGAMSLPEEWNGAAPYIRWLSSEFIPWLRDRKLVRSVDAQCDTGGFSPDQLREYLKAASDAGFPLRLHGDRDSRAGAAALAVEVGCACVAGLNRIDAADIALLAASTTAAVLLPTCAPLEYPAPGRQLIDAGAVVAIATGFHPARLSTFNMQTVIAFGCAALSMTPEEAIVASTVNAAYALGRSGVCGILESGRDADLLILNASDYREIPLHFGGNLVSLVMHRGRVIWRENPLT